MPLNHETENDTRQAKKLQNVSKRDQMDLKTCSGKVITKNSQTVKIFPSA